MIDLPKFSILDTRQKKWKDNERYWINTCGIQSELGRGDTNSKSGFWEIQNSVSIFSPTLSELAYDWFCPTGGSVLDPFAGGSVRGIVAEESGFSYTGIDLSKEQIEANRKQSSKPNWIIGDSQSELPKLDEQFDFVFTCPPYHDLELYSNDPLDISNMEYWDFLEALHDIITKSVDKLKDNRFFGIVVSEIRDTGSTRNYKIGKYKRFVPAVIDICEDIGLHFYNDMILYNSQHQASRTSKTYFDRNRKIASVHQNVLIFVKGNPDLATEAIEDDGTRECTINGTSYKTFRGAAIAIDPIELVGSEVKRRCDSPKSKYKGWQLYGTETKPVLKYEIDGIPFESPRQISEYFGGDFTETMARTCINSNRPLYRHWKRINSSVWNISYSVLEQLQNDTTIRITLPVIACDGREFYSQDEAAEHFGVSRERIRQKLKDSNHPGFIYIK